MMQAAANDVPVAHKHPVMVKQPCGFCGNNPPYMCQPCNDYGSDRVFEEHGNRKSVVGSVPADFWFV